MEKSISRIIDLESGEIVEKEFTAKEEADLNASFQAKQLEKEMKENKRQEILQRLGLTAEEAALILK